MRQRHNSAMQKTPAFTAPLVFKDPALALAQVQRIYQDNVEFLRQAMRDFVGGGDFTHARVRACYPYVRLHTHSVSRQGSSRASTSSSGASTSGACCQCRW